MTSAANDTAGPLFSLGATANGSAWAYSLQVNRLGSGTIADPYINLSAAVEPGDTLVIAAAGARSPPPGLILLSSRILARRRRDASRDAGRR
jgi:hypothetical protein